MPRRGAAVAAAGVVALALSGCVGAPERTPTPPASASESAAPVFASDEEALAAAEISYARYLTVVDQLTQDGGKDPYRVMDVATEHYAMELLDSLRELRDSGNHTNGNTRFDNMRLVERSEVGGSAEVSVLLCFDVGDVRILDSTGADVTPADRPARSPIQAQFESSPGNPTDLLPSGSETWPGESFC